MKIKIIDFERKSTFKKKVQTALWHVLVICFVYSKFESTCSISQHG